MNMGVDGTISAIDCSRSPEITITMNLPKGPVALHTADFRRIGVSAEREEALPTLETCQEWTARRVKVWFRVAQGKDYFGEISKIYFY